MDNESTLELGDETYRPQKRLLSFLYGKKVYPIPREEERKLFPEKSSNWLSRVFFWWLFPLMHTGYVRTLQPKDLWVLTDEMKVENLSEIFNLFLAVEMERAKQEHIRTKCEERNETPETSTVDPEADLEDFVLSAKSLLLVLFFTMKRKIIIATTLALICLSAWAITPLLTKELIKYVESRAIGTETNVGKGIGYSFGVALVSIFSGLLMNHFFYIGSKMGAEVKVILTNTILRKSFKLNAKARHEFPSGKITSLITTDLSRIEIAALFQPLLICLPIPIVIAIIILIVNIRVSAVIGIVVFIVFLGFISFGAAKLFAYRDIVSKVTDRRVTLIREILNNLKIIKYYCWEQPFLENLTKVRGEEVDLILKIQTLRNVVFALAMTLTGISAMIAFIILYAIDGSKRSPANIFSSVSSFEIMAMMVFFIPQALSTTTDMILGLKRIGQLLSAGEETTYENYKFISSIEDKNAIQLINTSFNWEVFDDDQDDDIDDDNSEDEEGNKKSTNKLSRKEKKKLKKEMVEKKKKQKERKFEREQREKDLKELGIGASTTNFKGLQNINLTVKKGEFVIITGSIGSGKTSLLNAIAGFMNCEGGDIQVNGSLLLCGTPWIQNTTIRENITFGLEYDKQFYDDVIRSCSLHIDLDNFEGGDFTEVGEKGITLSGGQKARISLARAVYANTDIILMDDVLSAVDARVGKHILDQCLLGLLKDKTRILATHQLSLIGQADKIVFVNGDGSIDVGKVDELLLRNENFSKLMIHSKKENDEDIEIEVEEIILETKLENESMIHTTISTGESKKSVKTNIEIYDEGEFIDYNLNKDSAKGKIIQNEERAENSIKFEVYKNYISFGSGKLTPWGTLPIFCTLLALATFCEIFSNTWLSFWISNKFPHLSSGFYIGFYVLFNILAVIFLVATFVFFITITTVSSKNLNLMAMKRILYTPMSFMDTTPMGRIMNRFTKDTDALDNEISENLKFCLTSFARIIGIFILFIIYIPWMAIVLPFVLFIFVLVANFYQASNREVKRLEALLRSHVYNTVNESLSGMTTIKAYNEEERFCAINNKFLNSCNEATYLVYANQRWIGIWLDLLSNAIVFLIAILCSFNVFKIGPASVGLLLTYSLQITGQLTNLVRTFTEVENDLNSVERICHYALKLEQEAPYSIPNNSPTSDWPQHGEIEFSNVQMRYRKELPLVLKGISLKVSSGEKIGICGRTGAGKSSITTALYRLAELDTGNIFIDGIDIATIGLRDLRSKLSIIPQDPVLFEGTIRENLDPFNQYPDEKLWSSLVRTGLIEESDLENVKTQNKNEINKKVSDGLILHKFHLDQTVEVEGENFSLGERQLVAFARALVRESKILILDEATSSVDYETDSKIQKAIIKEFKDCTILTIAHRLKTILNYNRILVLEKGEVKEFDTPWKLYNSENGIFRGMCEKSHITQQDFS